MKNEPHQAAWLDGPALERQLASEQGSIAPVRDYAAAFRTPAVLLPTGQYLAWSIGIYRFILWLPSMLKTGSSMGIVAVGFPRCPTWRRRC